MLGKSDELRDRVEARKHALLAKLSELKADAREGASDARSKLEHRLEELELHLKAGWAKVNAEARTKLNHWLERDD
jgi:hypothetical protein